MRRADGPSEGTDVNRTSPAPATPTPTFSLDRKPLPSSIHIADRFFLGMSGLLLAIVLVGFSPTLYLRAWHGAPPVPAYAIVHGIVMTAWFVLAFLQPTLVAAHRKDIHRRIGWFAAGIGVLVLVAGAITNLGFAARVVATSDGLPPAAVSSLIWGNFAVLPAFAVLLATAISFRKRPAIHRRLMLLASIGLVAPALARLARLIAPELGALVPLAVIVLLLLMPAYELLSTRRIHPATIVGTGAFMLATFGMRAFGYSESGRSLLRTFF
jgi:hypothetical protein